ncbi:UDP-glycosyltransferase 87A2-like [Andrographis paniculata]|uniref:UDP-glycosyltransferase 87A2-like n=1 Tax=Andrographis paniculata TaxID=175694 RepID=UPI0021E82F45|nr:UDP-glycosyltransferase 87A2-like [Andrographis paniculata]
MACNVVAVPHPGRGHVNAMLNLSRLLASSAEGKLLITFVVTEEWLGLLSSEEKPPTIRFATIPNVLPSEIGRDADMASFFGSVQTKMEEPFEMLLDRLDAPVSLIIADTFLNWPVELGDRRNIPVALLWPMSTYVFSILYHFDLLVRHGHYPFVLSERGEERLDYIPGIQSIRLADIPAPARLEDSRLLDRILPVFRNVSRAKYLLFNCINELESEAIDALKQELKSQIYTLGPIIPHVNLQKPSSSPNTYSDWLDSQPRSSVLYLSLGSYISVSSAQMDEIADGLRESGVRFLWVAREDATRLQERCGDAGKVVQWCEQLRVLCHTAIGGFWTHCGWNSTVEAMYAGVPMIAFPLSADQPTNRKLIVEDWKIGWNAWGAAGAAGEGKVLSSREICRLVRKLMDMEGVERKETMGRVAEVQKACLAAFSDGGSSTANLSAFLTHLTAQQHVSV